MCEELRSCADFKPLGHHIKIKRDNAEVMFKVYKEKGNVSFSVSFNFIKNAKYLLT